MLTEIQRKEFEDLTKPLIKWINENGCPHSGIKIDMDHAELYSVEYGFYTKEFIRD